MNKNMKNNIVNGFLDVRGRKIVNGDGKEIVLTGWGIGNWMLCEGYMWKSRGNSRFDRPRRIESVIQELTGSEYARNFWKRFRENYFTEEDVKYMAELGYNSVRIPINSRLFLKEEPGINWCEEGFELLDKCIDWCEKYRIYAFIDLHGAPGGQTGDNIDDSIDDMPRLFMDEDYFDKGVELWKKLAKRYKDRWIVGGYDLLNEPIRPVRLPEHKNVDYLVPKLCEFYDRAISEIRCIDKKHLITLEGHHWATETNVFYKKYDEKMVIHFHRYACMPDLQSFTEYIELSKKWNCPIWLGETGENMIEWFTAMYPLSMELGIGYNVWPWKKMGCVNSPCSVNEPQNWDKIIEYTNGGKKPTYEEAHSILDEYLENMKLENCTKNELVSKSVLRQPGSIIRGTDFDELPGKGFSFSGLRTQENPFKYRINTGMEIIDKFPDIQKEFGFDCLFKRFVLGLNEGEFSTYSLNDITNKNKFSINLFSNNESIMKIYQDNKIIGEYNISPKKDRQILENLFLIESEKSIIKIEVLKGRVEVESIVTE